MSAFSRLETRINELKIDLNEEEMDVVNKLHNQLIRISNASYTVIEIESFIKGYEDVLDSNVFDSDSRVYEEIREIQDDIIVCLSS